MEASTADTPAMATICVRDVCKRYGGRQAVSGLSFGVAAGQICALLGPNGAGKTSTMRVLLGLSAPDGGSAHILGEPVRLGATVLRSVGALIDGPAFVPHLTGRRNLKLMWSAARRSWPPPAWEDALDLAGLGAAIDHKVKSYSMGMKQRLMLAQALMRAPRVLILDEPANGLDPAEVRALRQHLQRIAEQGAAVLVSSHQLAEVQQLATHAVVMSHGRRITAGALGELLGESGSYRVRTDDDRRATVVLRGLPGVVSVTAEAGDVVVSGPRVRSRDLVQALVTADIGVISVHQPHRTLEEAFLAMTEGHDQHVAR